MADFTCHRLHILKEKNVKDGRFLAFVLVLQSFNSKHFYHSISVNSQLRSQELSNFSLQVPSLN